MKKLLLMFVATASVAMAIGSVAYADNGLSNNDSKLIVKKEFTVPSGVKEYGIAGSCKFEFKTRLETPLKFSTGEQFNLADKVKTQRHDYFWKQGNGTYGPAPFGIVHDYGYDAVAKVLGNNYIDAIDCSNTLNDHKNQTIWDISDDLDDCEGVESCRDQLPLSLQTNVPRYQDADGSQSAVQQANRGLQAAQPVPQNPGSPVVAVDAKPPGDSQPASCPEGYVCTPVNSTASAAK